MSLLPLRGTPTTEPGEPRVVGLDGERADEIFDVLSAGTTREVLSRLYDQPATPAELRDAVGTSLQNVHYHLGKLEDANLIEAAGVGYSEKGTEMTVYAPTSEAVVLFAGRDDDRSRLRSLLSRLFGVAFALVVATLLLRQYLYGRLLPRFGGGSPAGGDGGADAGDGDAVPEAGGGNDTAASDSGSSGAGRNEATAPTSSSDNASVVSGDSASTPTEAAAEAARASADAAAGLDPALAFFLGGLFVLLAVGVAWYVTR
ncbi:ArsR/SmtB family transcription factor [Halomarina halobia]|uniref:ArsR/SmtB family transcription factor n=1 Tax=Halomarina halobia TaxID=3033386 RepID=A0ABD6A466_9EURY|nr:helix-turn-helix domain-containing protein [Halomarina sp. PSR21]